LEYLFGGDNSPTSRNQAGSGPSYVHMKAILTSLFLLLSPTLWAQFSFDQPSNTTAWLEAATSSIVPGETIEVAVVLEMSDHWHTYWRNHGDSGGPTEITWELPEGFSAGDIQWPTPERYNVEGLISFGYEGTAALLVPIQVPADLTTGSTVTLKANVDWLECKDVCIPGNQDVTLTLPVRDTPGSPNASFVKYRAAQPRDFMGDIRLTNTPEGVRYEIEVPEGSPMAIAFFPGEVGLWVLEPPPVLQQEGTRVSIDLIQNEGFPQPDEVEGVLRFADGTGLQLRAGFDNTPGPAQAEGETPEPTRGVAASLLLSLLAGLGMNLLPCIFPVLGLKISGFVEQAHGDRSRLRKHALVFAAGVLVSMWIVAAGVILVGGAWGAQFQDPRLVIGMLLILTFFTMNLFGVFEMGLGLTTVGGGLTQKQGYGGSFFQGILLTVIGTPCTGPILAGSIAWMLTVEYYISFLAFTLMGIGLAFPYVLLAFSPPLIERLPRPGNWMVTFKKASAFALVAFIWVLLYVLRKQIPVDGLVQVTGSLLLVCFAAWVLGTWDTFSRSKTTRLVAKGGTAFVLGFAIYTAFTYKVPLSELDAALQEKIENGTPIRWTDVTPELATTLLEQGVPVHYQPWSPEKVEDLLARDVPVFIDFTAEWCTICKLNKPDALHKESVMRAFAEKGIVTLRADYTKFDPLIGEALTSYGRRGLPVYVLYKEGTSAPVFLPERLRNPSYILDAL